MDIDKETYQLACRLADVEPSDRQWAKWNRHDGKAWAQRNKARAKIRNDLKKKGKWLAAGSKDPKTGEIVLTGRPHEN